MLLKGISIMSKKLTYEFVKNQFENEGGKLLSEEYVDAHTKLKYICSEGHEHSITWNNWQKGQRCLYCYGNVKKDIDFVRESFEKDSYILLTEEYINSKQKLEYICPNRHRHSISWANWRKGQRCHFCVEIGRKINIFNDVKLEFEKEKYELLTIEYINNQQKLEYICPNGHKHAITWNNWQQGNRCPYCAGQVKLTIEFIKKEFEKESCKLLSKEYIDNKQKLSYICPDGHIHRISWNSWKKGHRCPICKVINMSGDKHHNWKGGISCEPYCDVWLDKDFKESIKERDNHRCQNPTCWGTSKRLTIHHIDYDKKNCRPENLITLCASCNVRANYGRSWHKSFYRTIMEKKSKIKKFVVGL